MADVCFSKTKVVISQPSMRYVDKIWFAHRLWPSEGSDINKRETRNSIDLIKRYDFKSKQYYFRFAFVDIAAKRGSKSMSKPNFVNISIGGWDITTSVFEKQTSAILEIYFRFRFRPFARNLHIILHQVTEFRPNQSTHCRNMTLYPLLKMAAATAEYYFRFRICWWHCLQKVKIY